MIKKRFLSKDPAIQRATESAQITQRALDDYNPFAQNSMQPVS